MSLRQDPFQRLALSLSGGGYRAAAFHLGVLSYLHQVQWLGQPLLRRLAFLSTISGGTITGVAYALSRAEGRAFDEYFKHLYGFLHKDNLLDEALRLLNRPQEWSDPQKSKNLIKAFAEIYHRHLLEGQSFAKLLDQTDPEFEAMFNATDMEHRLPFRFQRTKVGLFGNKRVIILPEHARLIRLADIVATSSCFPGGFEPMVLPFDFESAASRILSDSWGDRPTIRLMDGGIVDNQGIESVMLAEERYRPDLAQPPYISTFIIADVATKALPADPQPMSKPAWWGRLTLLHLYAAVVVMIYLALLTAFNSSALWLVRLASAMATLCIAGLLTYEQLVKVVVGQVRKTVNRQSVSYLADLRILERTPLAYLVGLIRSRLDSVTSLSNLFLSRIRSIQYRELYGNIEWRDRLCPVYIYHLSSETNLSVRLAEIIHQANTMETTLWFSDQDKKDNMLDALVIAGQVTTCYKLKRYLENLSSEQDQFSEETYAAIAELQHRLNADFDRFQVEPGWLIAATFPIT